MRKEIAEKPRVLDGEAGMKLENLQIIYKCDKPHGIRDSGGFLFFFTKIGRYGNQEERYRREVKEQCDLADYLLEKLKKYSR